MKKIIVIIAALLTVASIWMFNNPINLGKNKSLGVVSQGTMTQAYNKKAIKKAGSKQLDDRLTFLAIEMAPPLKKELADSWQDEYGCYLLANDCQYSILNAQSYEEALWMRRKGYPSMSSIAMLQQLSRADLIALSEHGNSDAKKLLAIDALNKKKLKNARIYSRSSIAHGGVKETFGYRLLARAYLMSQEPIPATINLKIASILGDTEATAEYRKITEGTSASMIDNHNRMAYGYLDAWIKTPVSDWTNDPRPQTNGGG